MVEDILSVTCFPERSGVVVLPVISNVSLVSNSKVKDIMVKA